MRRFSICSTLIFVLGIFGAMPVFGVSPALMAVLDTPIDYAHPALAPFIAKEILMTSRFRDDDGVERSWWDLNQKEQKRIADAIQWRYFNDEIDFIEERRTDANIPNHAENFSNILTFVHGTHVAGIAAHGGGVRILNFPLNTLEAPFDLSKILAFDATGLRVSTHRRLLAISDALQRHKIRVVNMSLSSSNTLALQHAQNGASEEQKFQYAEQFQQAAEADAKIFRDELAWLYAQNPETVFVVSAGNQSLDLANVADHSSTLQAPNVLKVAALDGTGQLAAFSNYSSTYVQIAAPGVNIKSALARGGQLHLAGTSQAAPFVARQLAKIFAANEHLSAAQGIKELYTNHTAIDPQLENVVQAGRILSPNSIN